jgi:hypothetical protein
MRNKSCPIVTFQTERKRKLVPRFAIARGSAIGSPSRPSRCASLGSIMVNGKLRTGALGAGLRHDYGPAGRNFPQRRTKLRHSCNRFQRLSNWAVIGLEVRSPFSYLISKWGLKTN